MRTDLERLQQQLADLAEGWRLALPEQLEELLRTHRLLTLHGPSAEHLRPFHLLVHTLTGSAGTFGFHAVSAAARALEQRLVPYIPLRLDREGTEAPIPDDLLVQLQPWLDALQASISAILPVSPQRPKTPTVTPSESPTHTTE